MLIYLNPIFSLNEICFELKCLKLQLGREFSALNLNPIGTAFVVFLFVLGFHQSRFNFSLGMHLEVASDTPGHSSRETSSFVWAHAATCYSVETQTWLTATALQNRAVVAIIIGFAVFGWRCDSDSSVERCTSVERAIHILSQIACTNCIVKCCSWSTLLWHFMAIYAQSPSLAWPRVRYLLSLK